MRKTILTTAVVAAAAGVASAQTLDDLSIATLFPGDVVTGDTSTSSNDMNGSSIGGTTTGWFGGDDVYTVIWNGGDFVADLFFTHADGDLDLWLINDPAAGFANVIDSSLTTTDNE